MSLRAPSPADDPNQAFNQGAAPGSDTKTIFRPDAPTMGGLQQIKAYEYAAWTGGKPNSTWSELEDSTAKVATPQQFRYAKDDSAFRDRCQGLAIKFGFNDDLAKFQERLVDELETRGLDTISYLPDPTNSNNMVNIMTNHARFSTKYVATVGPAI